MPHHRHLRHARRCLPVLLAVLLLAASAAAADSSATPNGSITTTARLVPHEPVSGDDTPVAPGGTQSAITRIAPLPVRSTDETSSTYSGVDRPAIASVSPPIASAGTNTTITITGTGFGAQGSRSDVGFTSAGGVYWASGRTDRDANPNEIVNWSDTEIGVRVPTGTATDGDADSATSGNICVVTDANLTSDAVPFAVSFGVTGTKWAEEPVFLVNDNCPGVTGGADAVRRAAATWNAVLPPGTGSTARARPRLPRSDYDEVNVIAWGSPAGATIWYDENNTIVEADIFLDPDTNWTTGVAGGFVYSIESRMLEALGYGLGIASLAGEEPQGPSDAGKACSLGREDALGNMNQVTLHPADRAAATYLYGGGSANPLLLAAMFTADTIGGPAPLTVRFADTSLGGATGRAWDFGDGETSAEKNPAHSLHRARHLHGRPDGDGPGVPERHGQGGEADHRHRRGCPGRPRRRGATPRSRRRRAVRRRQREWPERLRGRRARLQPDDLDRGERADCGVRLHRQRPYRLRRYRPALQPPLILHFSQPPSPRSLWSAGRSVRPQSDSSGGCCTPAAHPAAHNETADFRSN